MDDSAKFPPNIAIIGTSYGSEFASAGAFTEALQDALSLSRASEGVRVEELTRRLNNHLRQRPGNNQDWPHVYQSLDQSLLLPLHASPASGLTATPETLDELDQVMEDTPGAAHDYFYPKAQGVELGEPGWYFSGRERQRRKLVKWLNRPLSSGMYVITGDAGQGKSALLGMLLASADPRMIAALKTKGRLIPQKMRPPVGGFTAAISVSGATFEVAVGELAKAMKIPDSQDVEQFVLGVKAMLALQQRPCTVILDALDESRDPFTIAALLRELASQGLPGLRLLVGTRPTVEPSQRTLQGPTADQNLLVALGVTSPEKTVRKMVLKWEWTSIHDYAVSRLNRLLGPQPDDLPTIARIEKLARRIAERRQPFLFARLAVSEFAWDIQKVMRNSF